jgi:hypothetical protein
VCPITSGIDTPKELRIGDRRLRDTREVLDKLFLAQRGEYQIDFHSNDIAARLELELLQAK